MKTENLFSFYILLVYYFLILLCSVSDIIKFGLRWFLDYITQSGPNRLSTWQPIWSATKGVMQGKLIAVVYTLRTYCTLWAEFVNKNRCISVRLVSEEVKSIKFDHFENSHNNFLWPEYFIDFLCERWIPCQASISVLCLH